MYFDTCYIVKFYFNEADSRPVRELVRSADVIHSSQWALVEFHAVLHRRLREGDVSPRQIRAIAALFSEHIDAGLWQLIPAGSALLRRTCERMLAAPRNLFLRTADAVHLMTAHELGEREVWTTDRHMLAAAAYFGLKGRS